MRKLYGFSLVELMISITLGLILMTGVMKLFLSSKVVFSTQQGLSRIQETGRLAIDFLSRDLAEAAHYGCHRPNPSDSNLKLQGSVPNPQGLHANFEVGIIGYDSVANLPGGAAVLGANVTPVVTSTTAPAVTANVLVIRSANQQGLILNTDNTANALTAFTTAQSVDGAGCISGVCANGVALVADCYKSRVFRVSELTNIAGNSVTVRHADSWGGQDKVMENFTNGAELLGFNTNVYFLATSASGDGASLWQQTNGNTAFELFEGVEQMRIAYAVEDSTNYQTAAEITAANLWPRVWSVRVELLVRSLEDNVLDEKQPYSFAGAAPVTPNDRRLRQVFTVTTALRSRMAFN